MRRVWLILGLCVLAAVWLTGLPQLARQAFFAHMTMHMGVVAVAAPLLALGVARGRFDPVRKAPGLFAPIQSRLALCLQYIPALAGTRFRVRLRYGADYR